MNILTGAISIFILTWMDISALSGSLKVNSVVETIYMILYYFSVLSINLAVFNLIPLPPLDGSKILAAFLPDSVLEWFERYDKYCMIVLLVALYFGFLDGPIGAAYDFIHDGIWKMALSVLRYQAVGTV